MAFEGREVIAYIRKGLILSVRTSCRSACDHPFVLGMLVFLLLLYRSFPSLFSFLISSSPVIICTALLLGTLLSYGEPNIPEIEEEHKKTHDISSLNSTSVADDLIVEMDDNFVVQTHVESKREIDEMAVNLVALGERRATSGSHGGPHVPSTSMHSEDEEEEEEGEEEEEEEQQQDNDTFIAARPLVKEDGKEIHIEEKETEEDINQGFVEKREFSEEKVDEGVKVVGEHASVFTTKDHNETEDLKGEVDGLTSENLFDFSLGSPWQPIDHHEVSSDSESDQAESSSPDASMADIIPMLDELHPLLDSEVHQPVHDHASDNGSTDDVENQEDEEDEEGHDEKDDGAEVAVTWTTDDQKNLMDLGTSELERNQRLENLIAKRRARKNLRLEAERNLVDLHSNDTAPIMEHLSHLLVQIPRISAPRRNPFDLPYDADQTTGIPPIPGSAPSVLLPRGNPFDFPYDQVDESGSHAGEGSSHQEFLASSQTNMLFRRHESFAVGSSFVGELDPERNHSKLRPYFVPERMDSDDSGFAKYQRQSSEMSDSKVSSVPESDSASSVADQEDHKELIEQELHREGEQLSHAHDVVEPVVRDGHSSFAVDSVTAEQELSGMVVGNDREVGFHTFNAIEGTHQLDDAFGAVEEEIEFNSPILESANVEVIEEKYDDTSSTSSLEVNEKSFQMSNSEEPEKLQQARGVFLKPGVLEHSHLLSSAAVRVNDSQFAGPIYDSIPSAIEKSLPTAATLDEALHFSGKEGMNSISSLASGMQAKTSVDSPSKPLKKNAVSEDQDFASASGIREEFISGSAGLWVASSDLCSVDENESRSKEVSEIKEDDVIGRGYFRLHGDISDPVAPVMPMSASSQIMHQLSFTSMEIESHDDKPVDMKVSLHPGADDTVSSTVSNSDKLVLSNDLTSTVSEEEHESIINPTADVLESHVSILDLPLIPEEKLEDSKLEEESDIMINPTANIALNGLQMIGKPYGGPSDLEQMLFFLHRKSSEETAGDDNTNRLVLEAGNGASSIVSPMVSSHDGSVTGLSLLEPAESVGFLNPSEMNSEIENTIRGDLADLKVGMISNLQSKKDGGFPEKSSDSEESGVIHAEVQDVKGFDENLLSELDAVGDFRVNELKSDQIGSLVDQQTTIKSGVGSSLWPCHEDLELKVCHSKFHVLDVCSIEGIDSAYKQLPPEASTSSILESTLEKELTVRPEVVSNESNDADRGSKVSEADSELLFVEAKLVDDISSAFKQLDEGSHDNSLLTDIKEPEIPPSRMHAEFMGTLFNMPVIEAKSFEDRDLALKQLADDTKDKFQSSWEPTDWFAGVETSKRHLEPEVLEDCEVKEADSEQMITEVYSMEDVSSAFEVYNKEGFDGSAFSDIGQLEFMHAKSIGTDSDLHVVEATSLIDINNAFRQLSESSIKSFQNEPKDESTEVEANERHLEPDLFRDSELTNSDSELLVLEAKSIEDINSAFKQVTKRVPDTSILPEVGSSDILPGRMHMEPIEAQSDMQVIEAKSLEDLHLALNQISDGSPGSTSRPRNIGDGSAEAETSKPLLEDELLEVQPTENVDLTFKVAVPEKVGSASEQSSENFNEVEEVTGICFFGPSTSGKTRKRDKSHKSRSSLRKRF